MNYTTILPTFPCDLPIVTRQNGDLTAQHARLRLALSRCGGVMELSDVAGKTLVSAELFAELETPTGAIRLRQGFDHGPRQIVCEQGPVRVVLRSLFDLLDSSGRRWGEGVAEWALYADGALHGGVALSIVDVDWSVKAKRAGLRITGIDGARRWISAGTDGKCDAGAEASVDAPVPVEDWCGLSSESGCLAWRAGKAVEYEGGCGPWHSFGDLVPYYEDWGNLLGQGWGESGWREIAGSASQTGAEAGESPDTIEMIFGDGMYMKGGSVVELLQGHLLWQPQSGDYAMARIAEWRRPAELTAQGGDWRGFALLDGNHLVYAPDATSVTLSAPASDAATVVNIYGLSHWGGWRAECDGQALPLQLTNDGRGTDDPYGMQLGRFDDRHGPITGATDVPANRIILMLPPSRETRTVELRAAEGLAMAYLRWDDRMTYLIQSSAKRDGQLMEFAARNANLRSITAPHSQEITIDVIPLYWFQVCATSPYLAAEEVTQYQLEKADPEEIRLKVSARNRYGVARGSQRASIPFRPRATRIEVEAEVEAMRRWEFKDLQLLNLFPQRYRGVDTWAHQFSLALDSAGRRMLKHPRVGRLVVEGVEINDPLPPFFYAQYAAPRGNFFVLQSVMEGPVTCEHFLCAHWIDSHFHVVCPKGYLDAGEKVSGSYVVLIDDGADLNTEQVEAVGKAALAGGDMEEALQR